MPGQHGRSTQTEPNDVARPEPQADEQEKNRTAPRANGRQKLSEIECKPTGAECEGTASGKKAKVTMYFNGPTLVQLETVGSDVIKRQFTVREQPRERHPRGRRVASPQVPILIVKRRSYWQTPCACVGSWREVSEDVQH